MLAALLGACATSPGDEIPYTDNLSVVWGEMMAPYGLYPLFPVGSDSQPGDMVMLCQRTLLATAEVGDAGDASNKAGTPPLEWVWVTSLKPEAVSKALTDRAASRMAYAASRTASAPSGAPLGPQEVSNPYLIGNPAKSLVFRSFPSVMAYTKSRGDVGAGGLAGIFAVGVGASKATNGYFILEVPGAEVVEMPFDGLQAAIVDSLNDAATKLRMESALKAALSGDGLCRADSLMIVKAVYYTRRLTATMGSSAAAAFEARAAYQIPAASTRAAVDKAVGAFAYGASAPAAPGSSPLPPDPTALARLV